MECYFDQTCCTRTSPVLCLQDWKMTFMRALWMSDGETSVPAMLINQGSAVDWGICSGKDKEFVHDNELLTKRRAFDG